MGIEPTALAWEARVLPLYDARAAVHFTRVLWSLANRGRGMWREKCTYFENFCWRYGAMRVPTLVVPFYPNSRCH